MSDLREPQLKLGLTNQQELWNRQHAVRYACGPEGTELRDQPNDAAILTASLLPEPSVILEAGSANGRDARFWARLGHSVHCMDFSQVALTQLDELARAQGVRNLLSLHEHDISNGSLPDFGDSRFDAFYARSALHLGDEAMHTFASRITGLLRPSGLIVIEGKECKDFKIARSIELGDGTAIDPFENGHLRRVWTADFMTDLCTTQGWIPQEISEHMEDVQGQPTCFLRLVANTG